MQPADKSLDAGNLDEGTLVAIAAALAVALKGKHFEIRRIHLAEQPSTTWSAFGRLSIHASHHPHKGY